MLCVGQTIVTISTSVQAVLVYAVGWPALDSRLLLGLAMLLCPLLVSARRGRQRSSRLSAASVEAAPVARLVLGQARFTTRRPGAGPCGMSQPSAVTVDFASGKVFVADTANHRVLRFTSINALQNGAAAEGVLGQLDFHSATPGTSQRAMRAPHALALDREGRLWVADTDNHRILRFDNASAKEVGAPADGLLGQDDFNQLCTDADAAHLHSPLGLAVDLEGRLWVADTGHGQVLRFDAAADKAAGSAADGVLGLPHWFHPQGAHFAAPCEVATDHEGRLWVADRGSHHILRFDRAAHKASYAPADGVLSLPDVSGSETANQKPGAKRYGVATDGSGTLWVADSYNNWVVWFHKAARQGDDATADGLLGQGSFTSRTPGTTASALNQPCGVWYDAPTDSLWIADRSNHRIVCFGQTVPPANLLPDSAEPYTPSSLDEHRLHTGK